MTKRDLDEVLQAITGSDGVKMVIAKRLDVTRHTLDGYLRRWKSAQDALDAEIGGVSDYARSVMVGNLKAAYNAQNEAARLASKETDPAKRAALWQAAVVDSADSRWWLSRKDPSEFGDKHDITSGGEPLSIVLNWGDNADADD